MQNNIKLLISESNDPWFNITVEDCIFTQMDPKQTVLFLWRNANTVIIGRAQNPWKECNVKQMEQDGIKLARRRSGGGAVFQDLGNSCFTFMAGKPGYDKEISTNIVINALAKLGIPLEASGRNDLVVNLKDGQRKVSGSAYKETKDRGFHHGTLMLDVDLNQLSKYLNPDKKKLEMKGIQSVRSRVMNLVELKPEIDHALVCDAIVEAFFEYYGTRVEPEYISPDNMPDFPGFSENFAAQSSWEWNFGHTPEFTHLLEERFVWGGVELHLDVINGKIDKAKVYTDMLDPTPLEQLVEQLAGVYYRPQDIDQACEAFIQKGSNMDNMQELRTWLVEMVK